MLRTTNVDGDLQFPVGAGLRPQTRQHQSDTWNNVGVLKL